MALASRKAHHLIFDRGAIAGPGTLDLTGIHRRAVEIGPNNGVRCRRRRRDMAGNLRVFYRRRQKRERRRWIVSLLDFQSCPVN